MKSLAGFLAGGKSTSICLLLCCSEGGHIPEPRSGRAASTAEGAGHACCLSSQLSGDQGTRPRLLVLSGIIWVLMPSGLLSSGRDWQSAMMPKSVRHKAIFFAIILNIFGIN